MTLKTLSQTQRVLRLAFARGDKGVCAVDFLLPDVVDGGKPITRLAARIKDLEDDGIRFTDGGRRHSTKVYVLDRASLAEAAKPPGLPAPATTSTDSDVDRSSSRDGSQAGGPGDTLFDCPPVAADAIRGEAA